MWVHVVMFVHQSPQEKKEQLKEDLRDKTSALHIDLNCLTHESVGCQRDWRSKFPKYPISGDFPQIESKDLNKKTRNDKLKLLIVSTCFNTWIFSGRPVGRLAVLAPLGDGSKASPALTSLD